MDALRAIAPGLWVADRPLRLAVGDIGTRMTVIRLADGGLFLHSPVRLDAETRRALDALGPVRAAVAPNKAHHLFVGDYRTYPEAELWAAPGLAEKRKDLPFDGTLSDQAPPAWMAFIESEGYFDRFDVDERFDPRPGDDYEEGWLLAYSSVIEEKRRTR